MSSIFNTLLQSSTIRYAILYLMRFILIRAILGLFFGLILISIIAYARGYRFNFSDRQFVSTGILAVNSSPDGARIYIDGKLKGATNTNITIAPGNYDIEIRKEGYTTWKENSVAVKGEVVTQIFALLFPQNPSLSPITSLGVVKVLNFPSVNKVIILSEDEHRATESAETVDSEELEKDGVFVLENGRRHLNIFNPLKLVLKKSQIPEDYKLADTEITISPDGKEMIFTVKTASNTRLDYLIKTEEKNDRPFNVTQSRATLETAWKQQRQKKQERILQTFRKTFFTLAQKNLEVIAFSPDETKVFYRAKTAVTIPIIIKPRLIGANQTPEARTLERGALYVYDKKEDRNYLIAKSQQPRSGRPAGSRPSSTSPENNPDNYLWYDANHLVFKGQKEISLLDYDGTHKETVYSGPYEMDFLAVTADGKLLIIANLNPQQNALPDVYAVGIR